MSNNVSAFQIKLNSALKKLGYHREPEFIPVYFFARSGSTVHGATLNLHPHCVSLNEALEHYTDAEGTPYLTGMSKKKSHEILAHYEHSRLALTRNNFLSIIKQHPTYQRAQKGKYLTHCFIQFNHFYFPIFQRQIDIDAFFSFIGKEFPGMVFIRRKNTLLKLISILRAQKLNVWHSHTLKKENSINTPVYLDPQGTYSTFLIKSNSLIEYLEDSQTVEDAVLKSAEKHIPNCLTLTYEEDIEPDVMIGVNKVLDFFKVPEFAQPLNIPIQKTSRGIKHDISNYDEIQSLLKGTSFEWMLA